MIADSIVRNEGRSDRRQSGSAISGATSKRERRPTALVPGYVSTLDRPFAIKPLSTYLSKYLPTLRVFLSHFLVVLLELMSNCTQEHMQKQ